jgi:hypothetical protein
VYRERYIYLKDQRCGQNDHGKYHGYSHLGVSINGGIPIAGWFVTENPIKMDDFGV